MLTTFTFPEAWKCAQMIPITKIPKPTSTSNFRLIRILPFLARVFEKEKSGIFKITLNK